MYKCTHVRARGKNVQPTEISQEIRHELEQTEPRFNLQ